MAFTHRLKQHFNTYRWLHTEGRNYSCQTFSDYFMLLDTLSNSSYVNKWFPVKKLYLWAQRGGENQTELKPDNITPPRRSLFCRWLSYTIAHMQCVCNFACYTLAIFVFLFLKHFHFLTSHHTTWETTIPVKSASPSKHKLQWLNLTPAKYWLIRVSKCHFTAWHINVLT